MPRATSDPHHGLWDLVVLCLLRERAMHPYEMQRLLVERHKDDVLVLKRGSLYHAIGRLQRAGLIATVETLRAGRRPERTIYRLTPDGRAAHLRWLQEMIARPQPERSDFMASISLLVYLAPADARARLEERARALGAEIAALESKLATLRARLPRIHLVELEYLLAMRRAEAAWVATVVPDLAAGSFTWDLEALLAALPAPGADPAETP